MNTICTLSMTGSCMIAGYYLLSFLLRESFSHRMRYLWLKFALIGYLLPLHWLGKEYVFFLRNTFGIRLTEISKYYNFKYDKKIITDERGRLYISEGLSKEIWFVILWFGIAIAILAVMLVKMCRYYKKLIQSSEEVNSGRMYELLSPTKRKGWFTKRIKLHLVEQNYCGSGGLFFPFIIMEKNMDETEAGLILEHELLHIKRKDTFFKALLHLAVCIHWFNPFAYLLKRQMERECEMSCDDRVLKNCSEEERAEYASFLVRYALKKRKGNSLILNLGNNEIPLMERINNIMNNKEKNMGKSIVCVVLMAVILFCSSFTVLAYDTVYMESRSQNRNTNGFVKHGESYFFDEDDDTLETYTNIYTILYDRQFMDEEGNIYELTEEAQTYTVCVHQYVAGKYAEHTKNADGSCKITVYLAQRCTKCESVDIGNVFYELSYPVCSH